jgi:cell division protein FtsW (lipid II flippase)
MLVSGTPNISVWVACIGGVLLILPQAIWLLAADKIASRALDTSSSALVTGLVTFFVLALGLSYGVLLSMPIPGYEDRIFLLANILFPASFVALFASIIMVSRRVINAEDNPNVARGSRIFVLCIAFFYVIIGMFFIAPRLKRLRAKGYSK